MKKIIRQLAMTVLILCLFTSCNYNTRNTGDTNKSLKDEKILKVHFIDVGQGDATLIELNGYTALIDAGPNFSSKRLVNYLRGEDIKRIDYIIATHPDEDHIGGMDEILKEFKVKNFYAPKLTKNTETFKKIVNELKKQNLKIIVPYQGMELDLGEEANLIFLTPLEYQWNNDNNFSLVTKINFKDTSILFMGDSESEVERQLLKDSHVLESNIVKLGHHGSKSSTSIAFLDKVAADYAIISCGKNNKYGHPHKETIDKLDKLKIKYYRTDLDGNIIFRSDGDYIIKD